MALNRLTWSQSSRLVMAISDRLFRVGFLKSALAFSKDGINLREVQFEFDPAKSEANRCKHGIDFEQARPLWLDPRRLILAAASTVESRHALVAQTGGKVWFAVFTVRQGRIRIISVRRARDREVKSYENK